MEDNSKKILRYPLLMLKWIGLTPDQSKISYFVVGGIYSVFATTSLILIALQLIYANGNMTSIARNTEAVITFTQFTGKVLVTAVKLKNFKKLIGDAAKFWSIEKCAGEIRIQIEHSLARTLYLQTFFVLLFVLLTTMVIPTKQLPTGMWMMTNHTNLFRYAFISEEILISPMAVYFVGYDTLFLGFCTNLITQFTMLSYFLQELKTSVIFSTKDERIYLKRLMSYIVYHEFLLRFSRVLQDTYSPVLLIEYSTIIVVLCVEMFAVFESEDIFQFARSFIAMSGALLQLAFYCIPLNHVTDEASSISEGIYGSDWYLKHVSSLNAVVPIIIQRSQKEIIFKAGGLVEMNCRTVLNIVRMSYSVCAIMRALKNV